jgi:hypothetical protein
MEDCMRAIRTISVAMLLSACAPSTPAPRAMPAARQVAMDTAVARRICADADSVIAGRSACVLRDQSRRPDAVRRQ